MSVSSQPPHEPAYPSDEPRPGLDHKKSTSENLHADRTVEDLNQQQLQAAGYVSIEARDLWTYLAKQPGLDQPDCETLLRPLVGCLARLAATLVLRDLHVLDLKGRDLAEKVEKES